MRDTNVDELILQDMPRTLRGLHELGFQVLFRTSGWVECLAAGQDEAWRGVGVDEEGALRDLLRSMLPSKAARVGFDAWLRGLVFLSRHEQTIAEIVTNPYDAEISDESAPISFPLETSVDAPAGDPLPSVEGPPFILPESFGFEAPHKATSLEQLEELPKKASTPPEEPLPSVEEAFERLSEIFAEIREKRDDLGLMCASYQRLLLASWIAHARSVQEAWPREREVERVVHDVARVLTDLSKRFWPGNVRALQLATHPTQALDGLVMGPVARTWAEVFEQLQRRLDQAFHTTRDEWGWSDTIKCLPSDPSAVLEEAVSKIESVTGPLSSATDVRRRQVANNVLEDGMEDLVLAAHLLRWVRSSDVDGTRWGSAMGVLRWVVYALGHTSQPLREILEEHFVPSTDWAELLGRDPKINRAKEVRRRVLTEIPASTATREEVCAWLVEAFSILTNPQIAKLLSPVQGVVLGLTGESFAGADRNVRSRLRRLQEILRKGVDATVALPECEPASSSELASSHEHEHEQRSAADLLLERVRPIMRGKRLLFVSNREDDLLQARLQEDLGCSVTVRDGGTDRKAHLVASSVTPGAYDLILVASSFVSHKLDGTMAKLAKQIGVPYVRVNKGRPLATIRALTRHFVGEEA